MIEEEAVDDFAACLAAVLLERRCRLPEAYLDKPFLRIQRAMNLMMCVVDCNQFDRVISYCIPLSQPSLNFYAPPERLHQL